MDFTFIPSALRYPGAYVEIDGSAAGLGSGLPSVLLVGQKLPEGTAATGEVVRVASAADAAAKAGAGSMLAQMAARYRAVDPTFDLYMLPYSDAGAGVAATGTLTVSNAATASGALALYIGQRLVTVAVTAGQARADTAGAIVAAITAYGSDMPVTAAAEDDVVTLTARHKGTCGNDIDVRVSLYGEAQPAGLVLDIAAMSGGAGDPAPGVLAAMIGQRWFRYVVLGINDAATLAAWHAESQRRYQPPVQAGFRAFAAFRGDYAAAAAFGETKNYEHIADAWTGTFPLPTWESAAILAAAAAPRLNNNPVASLEGTPLPGMVGSQDYNDFSEGNSLLFKGMSVLEVGADGSVSIKRLISMYQRRSDGSTDDSFLDINVAEAMERIRYEQRIGAIAAFRGTVAAKTNEGYRPGLRITTEDGVRAFLLDLYKSDLLSEKGWVQGYDYYKTKLVVQQDADNPNRFNYSDQPIINSPFYILAGRGSFRRAVPA